MVKRITGEQTQRHRGRGGESKPYSYASREGMTGGSVTEGPGSGDDGNRPRARKKQVMPKPSPGKRSQQGPSSRSPPFPQ